MSKEFDEQHKEAFREYLTKETDSAAECVVHNQSLSKCGDAICEILSESKEDHEEFDMYARDVNDYEWLQEFVPGLIVYSAGGFFPFQASGYIKDLHFYFRAEDGYASMRLADSKNDCHIPVRSLYSSTISTRRFSDDVETLRKMWVSYLLTCVDQLKRTEYLYHFESNEVDFESDSGNFGLDVKRDESGNILPSRFGEVGWGYTADEAFAAASDRKNFYSLYCVNHYGDMKEVDEKIWQRYEDRLWSEEKLDRYLELLDVRPAVREVEGLDREYPVPEPIFEVKVPEMWRKDDGMIEMPVVRAG